MNWVMYAELAARALGAIGRLVERGVSKAEIEGRIDALDPDFDKIDADVDAAARGRSSPR